MAAFDENRDGKLSFNEKTDQQEFGAADGNHDGALNRQEFGRVNNPAGFNAADTNKDGLVDAPEFGNYERAERGGVV